MKAMLRSRGEAGFSLTEVLTSILVFALVTVGVVPLLALSMTSSTDARSKTAGRNVVRQMMEHVRGIKYFVSYDARPGKVVDLLDLYFPRVPPNGTMLPGQTYAATTNPPLVGTGGVFTTVCSGPSATNPACPADLPLDYTLTIKASFVKPVLGTSPQTYAIQVPPTNYQFDSSVGGNAPPADLMDISVRADWTSGTAEPQSFELRSIIGARRFSPVAAVVAGPSASPPPASAGPGTTRIGGRADSEYLLQLSSGFSTSTMPTYTNHGCVATPCKSEATLTAGVSSSSVSSADYVTADQETRYGNVRVVRTYDSSPPASPPPDLKLMPGAFGIAHAPPDYTATNMYEPALGGASSTTVNNPDIGTSNIASFGQSFVSGVKTGTSNELPYAEGNWTATSATATSAYFHHVQADFAGMKLDNDYTTPMIRSIWTSGTPRMDGFSKVNTYPITDPATRRVEATVQQRNRLLYFLRLNFGGERAVATIQDFQANVTCKATGNPNTAVATATWNAGFFTYPSDSNPGDNKVATTLTGNTISLNGTAGTDPLQAIKASNPLVWDGSNGCVTSACDIFLFEERSSNGTLTKRGYLSNWSSNKNVVTNVSPDGREVSASIDGAIRIDTAPVNPAIPESTINLSLGKLSCHAVDNR